MKSIVVARLSRKEPVSFARGIVAASALLLSASVYANVTIDNFVDVFTEGDIDASNVVVANGAGATACGQATQMNGLIIGGERDVFIEVTEGERGVTAEADGILAISSELQTSGTVLVQWDGNDNGCNLAHRLGADLTVTGSNQFAVTVIEADKDATVVFRVYTTSANWSEYSLFVPDRTRNRVFTFGFSAFEVMAGSGVSWSNVTAITMSIINAPTNFEIGFDMIVTPVEYDATADSVADGQVCWGTATETDNEGFYVGHCQSVSDLRGCKALGFVEATGVGGAGDNYCFETKLLPNREYGVVDVDTSGNFGEPHSIGTP